MTSAKVLSLLNGITCIIPVLAPVLGHLIMLKFPWQSLFWAMAMMGIAVLMLSLFILKETRPAAPAASDKPRENSESPQPFFPQPCCYHHPQRFGDPHFRQYIAGIADGNHGF